MDQYPEYKKTIWRAIRSFSATFIALVGASLAQAAMGISVVGVDFTSWQGIAKTLAIPFIAAFITALGKALRDKFGGSEYEKPVDKLII